MFTKEQIDDLFEYHAPTPDQIERLKNVRSKAKELAEVIIANTPASADQSAAMRKLRDAVMTANAAIIFEGRH